jgi:hypothetical protein
MARRFGRDDIDIPEIRGAPARPASFEEHQRRLGGDAKIRDWLDSPAPRPVRVTTITIFEVRLAVSEKARRGQAA